MQKMRRMKRTEWGSNLEAMSCEVDVEETQDQMWLNLVESDFPGPTESDAENPDQSVNMGPRRSMMLLWGVQADKPHNLNISTRSKLCSSRGSGRLEILPREHISS